MKISSGIIVALLLLIGVQRVQLWAEKRHSVKVERRLVETAQALERLKSDTVSKTQLAKAQDAANAARVERDQLTKTQETLSAYQKDLAGLRARYDALRLRTGKSEANPGSGGSETVPGVPDAPGGVNGFSLEDRLLASEQALRLKGLQEWVRAQQGVAR